MTNEEAIAEINDIYQNALDYKDTRTTVAFKMAIDALECVNSSAFKDGYMKGKEDREKEIIDCINHYTDMLINALNDNDENPTLHDALATMRANEIEVRKIIVEQIKEQRMKAVPIELKQAQAFIDEQHRHHLSAHRDKFRIGCEVGGVLVGVVQVGRPVSRYLDNGKTLEVLRLCSDGTKDVCSFLYSKSARIAKEMGYTKIITYILETEDGASLKASGWHCEADDVGGKHWDVPSRPREVTDAQMSLFEQKPKYPVNVKKQRWAKEL